ncbi:MAG: MmcQ/YjbR family DNA-binding protein [Actinomycetia bacterium]|nr:MmcQ/YjbR family DNA-binding protein [Actinomycetes bacterium]
MTDATKIEQAHTACAGMPGAVLEFPFGDDAAVYKVGGKIFALATINDEPGYVTLKVDPDDGIVLRAENDFIREGYYMNKRHWITVDLVDGAPVDAVRDLIEDSCRLVAASLTRAQRAELRIVTP